MEGSKAVALGINDVFPHAEVISSPLADKGEGKLDEQTAMGKAPLGIAQLASKYKIPVIALAKAVPSDARVLNELGITSCFSIGNAPMPLEETMDSKVTFNNLRRISRQLFELIHGVVKKAEQLQ